MTKNTDPAGLSSSPKPLSTQYRVIADRDKGDRIGPGMIEPHDRVTYVTDGDKVLEHLVRIERPVPTTYENVYTQSIRAFVDSERPAPSLPTREQIADIIDDWDRERVIDNLLALIQEGADRG